MRYENENEEKKMMSISDIGKIFPITRQAIFVAIKNKRLKAKKHGGQWRVNRDDLDEYFNGKYDRKYSKINGELIYDPHKGEISVIQATKILGIGKAHIYHAIRTKKIGHIRKGTAYILDIDDVKNYMPKDNRKFRCSLK